MHYNKYRGAYFPFNIVLLSVSACIQLINRAQTLLDNSDYLTETFGIINIGHLSGNVSVFFFTINEEWDTL